VIVEKKLLVRLLAAGCPLLAAGCSLSAIGYSLSAKSGKAENAICYPHAISTHITHF
jgi:hypothetical protein